MLSSGYSLLLFSWKANKPHYLNGRETKTKASDYYMYLKINVWSSRLQAEPQVPPLTLRSTMHVKRYNATGHLKHHKIFLEITKPENEAFKMGREDRKCLTLGQNMEQKQWSPLCLRKKPGDVLPDKSVSQSIKEPTGQ